MKRKILIVDDDEDLSFIISEMLENHGYGVCCAKSGEKAFEMLSAHSFHLILLDINLPRTTGFELCQELRKVSNVPVIFASARTSETDRITGFDIGGDDYLPKPYSMKELLARVNSQLRRYGRFMERLGKQEKEEAHIHVVGGLELNEETVEVFVDGEPVKLTPMEYKILLLLIKNPGRVFSAEEIYERVWNERAINTDTIMVHVRNIREKIEINPKEPKYLKVVWGVGYKIEKQA